MRDDVSEHNRGQRDAAQAGFFARLVLLASPHSSERYTQGVRHACFQTLKTPLQTSEPPTLSHDVSRGTDVSDDMPWPLLIIFIAAALVVVVPVLTIRWMFGSAAHAIVGTVPILFLLASSLPQIASAEAVLLRLFFATAAAAMGYAIGERKRRPWTGFFLGLFFPVVGWLFAALLPHHETDEPSDVRSGSVSKISWRLSMGLLSVAPLLSVPCILLLPKVFASRFLAEISIVCLSIWALSFFAFMWNVWHNDRVPQASRPLWTAVLLFLWIYAAPVYFWKYVR